MIEAQVAYFARELESGASVLAPLRGLGTLWERLPPDVAAGRRERLIGLIDPHLDSQNEWVRANAVRAMARVAGKDAPARLTRLLDVADLPGRPDRQAIRAVGQIDPDAVLDRLLALLREPPVLGPRGEPPFARVAAEALAELRHPDAAVAHELIAALVRIPRPWSVEITWQLDNAKYLAADIRRALIRVSRRDPGVREATIRELNELRAHARDELRADAIRVLSDLAAPGSRELAVAALYDPSLSVRLGALSALMKTDAALEAITTAAEDPDPRMRELAADRFADTPLPVDDLAARLWDDPDPAVRERARGAARWRVRGAPVERLREWLDDERQEIRDLATTALAKRASRTR